MKIAMALDYTADPRRTADSVADLERAGLDVAWVAELYSFDAVSILGYMAARTSTMELGASILPIYSRTPTLLAMTAAGLDAVSGGRFVLGIGSSGPQVIEGWHGVPFDRPLARTREIITICRRVWRRERLVNDGPLYPLPLPPAQGTGLGRPLKLLNHPVRPEIPIFVAALGPRNVELTAELADGWMPLLFEPERARDVWGPSLESGTARRGPQRPPLAIVAGGLLAVTDDPVEATAIRDSARGMIALYVGGMGARDRNFYNDLFRRYGYEAEAEAIQDAYLDGRTDEAASLVPEDFLKSTALVGDEGWVRERLEAYRAAGVTHMQIIPAGPDPLALIERLKTWLA